MILHLPKPHHVRVIRHTVNSTRAWVLCLRTARLLGSFTNTTNRLHQDYCRKHIPCRYPSRPPCYPPQCRGLFTGHGRPRTRLRTRCSYIMSFRKAHLACARAIQRQYYLFDVPPRAFLERHCSPVYKKSCRGNRARD